MTRLFEGGCLCGAVRLQIDAENARMVDCHCTDCRKIAGGGPSHLMGIAKASFSVTHGEATGYTVTGESGKPVTRYFCRKCGSPLYSKPDAFPGFVFVKVGALDSDPGYKPALAVWTDSAPAWHDVRDTPATRRRG